MNFLFFNLTVGICNMLLVEILKRFSKQDKDIFELMDEVNEMSDDFKKNTGFDITIFLENLISFAQQNPLFFYIILYLMLSLPIINIVTFISYVINTLKNIKQSRM